MWRVGEMAQCLKTLAALAKDQDSVLSTHWRFTTVHNPVPGNLMPSFGLCEHDAPMWYTSICIARALTHRIKINHIV